MKRTFNYLLPVLLLVLGYFVYMQWFSPSKPLLLLAATKATFPSPLASLPIKSLDGQESTLRIDESPYTVFLIDVYNTDFPSFYSELGRYHEMLMKKGFKIVYLWAAVYQEDDTANISKLVQNDKLGIHAVLDRRKFAEYQALGLQFSTFPLVFVYDRQGNKVYDKNMISSTQIVETIMSLAEKEAKK